MKKAIKTINPNEEEISEPGTHLTQMLYDRCVDLIENEWDDMDVRQKIATISAIGRIEVQFIKIRENSNVRGNSGSAVKRYEKAFAANAARKRRDNGGVPLLEAIDDDELEY